MQHCRLAYIHASLFKPHRPRPPHARRPTLSSALAPIATHQPIAPCRHTHTRHKAVLHPPMKPDLMNIILVGQRNGGTKL